MDTKLNNLKYFFKDKEDTLYKLLDVLPIKKMMIEDWVIIAISSGAVYFAEKIAKKTNSSFELLFTEPITAPHNKDCEIAMVSETEEIVIHKELVDSFNINIDYVYGEANRKYEEKILKYIYRYRKGESIKHLVDKNILLIDEGTNTGLTSLCCIKTLIGMNIKSISFASPIMSIDVANMLDRIVDDIYTVSKVEHFVNLKYYYNNYQECDNNEVDKILETSNYKNK